MKYDIAWIIKVKHRPHHTVVAIDRDARDSHLTWLRKWCRIPDSRITVESIETISKHAAPYQVKL